VDGALAVSALAAALGTLTRYAFVAVLLPLLVYVAFSFPKQWYIKSGLCLGVFLLVLTPWMIRNWRASQTLFGLTHYELYEGTGLGTSAEVRQGQLQRTYLFDPSRLKLRSVLRKALLNMRQAYEVTLKNAGENYLLAFFLASLLHRWRRDEVFRLRRLVFWTLLGAVFWLGVAGSGEKRNFINVFMPLVIIYGSAFFYVLFERLGADRVVWRAERGAVHVCDSAADDHPAVPAV
jgi:hypothetical protein